MFQPFAMTSLFAVIFAILYMLLSLRIVKLRMKHQAALGDKGDDTLQRAIRAHGNFAEYVPFGLLLMLLVEAAYGAEQARTVGILLALGRILHIYSVIIYEARTGSYTIRTLGMATTFGCFTFAGILLLRAYLI